MHPTHDQVGSSFLQAQKIEIKKLHMHVKYKIWSTRKLVLNEIIFLFCHPFSSSFVTRRRFAYFKQPPPLYHCPISAPIIGRRPICPTSILDRFSSPHEQIPVSPASRHPARRPSQHSSAWVVLATEKSRRRDILRRAEAE